MVTMRLANAFSRQLVAGLQASDWYGQVDAAPAMFAVLRAAGYMDCPSQRDIAATIMLDPSDLVAVLDRMENNGWVTRQRDPADRRRSIVRITDTGREYLDRYNAVAVSVGDRMMSELDDDDRVTFVRLASRMLEAGGESVPTWSATR
jgi:DNA-binding MarR family transcriptional regulator